MYTHKTSGIRMSRLQNVQLQITFFSSLRINYIARQKRFRSSSYMIFRLTEQGGEVMNSESLPPVRSVNGRLVTEVTHMWGVDSRQYRTFFMAIESLKNYGAKTKL